MINFKLHPEVSGPKSNIRNSKQYSMLLTLNVLNFDICKL